MKHIATVVLFATVFVLGIAPKARAGRMKNAQTLRYRAASDTPAQELFSIPMSRPLLPALSLRSVGRPSTGRAILTQPQP